MGFLPWETVLQKHQPESPTQTAVRTVRQPVSPWAAPWAAEESLLQCLEHLLSFFSHRGVCRVLALTFSHSAPWMMMHCHRFHPCSFRDIAWQEVYKERDTGGVKIQHIFLSGFPNTARNTFKCLSIYKSCQCCSASMVSADPTERDTTPILSHKLAAALTWPLEQPLLPTDFKKELGTTSFVRQLVTDKNLL